MLYIGKTEGGDGRIVTVEIETGGDRTQTIRLDTGDIKIADGNSITITGETNDILDPALRHSAKVTLLTREFIPDMFRKDPLSAKVLIKSGDAVLFRGYVLPRTYSQKYSAIYEELEVNCVDCISVLENLKWRGVGASGTDWGAERKDCGMLTIREVITQALSMSEDEPVIEWCAGIPLMSAGGSSALDGIKVDERLFMGESEEDTWTALEVLQETLRYLNLHITQEGGKFYVFTWDYIKGLTSKAINSDNCYGTDTSIEIGETFNVISVECDAEEVEEIIPDPFDDSKLTSPYDRRTWYCQEFTYDREKASEEADVAWRDLLMGGKYPQVKSEAVWRRDWWVRVMEAEGWNFYCRQAGHVWDGTFPAAGDARLYYPTRIANAEYENRVPDDISLVNGAAVLRVSTGKTEYKPTDNGVATDLTTRDVFVVGVGGTGYDPDKTGTFADPAAENNAAMPRAIYTGEAVTLSPEDGKVTRYLDISGKITLAPLLRSMHSWKEFSDKVTAEGTQFDWFNYLTQSENFCKVGEDKLRYLMRRYFESRKPVVDDSFEGGFITVNAAADGGASRKGLDMFESSEAPKFLKYERLFTATGVDTFDTVSKLGVLECMLIVGNKCLVEVGANGRPGDYEWRTFKEMSACADAAEFYAQSFTIGIDPKIGDFIIGTEFDIKKNMPYIKGLDIKGTAIPISKSDHLSGKVRFAILRPCDIWWKDRDCIIYARNGDLYIEARPDGVHVNEFVSAIWIEDFSVKVVTDNGGADPLDENDLVYMSDTDESFCNPMDAVQFKICSGLTADELAELGVPDRIRTATAIDASTGAAVTSVYDPALETTGKPEQIYVDYYYREMHEPRLMMTQSYRQAHGAAFFRTWTHLAFPDKTFYPIAVSRDLMAGSMTLTLREI